jgi:hypothetical protein
MNDLDKAGDETLVPDPRVADRYGVCIRTLRRWEETPKPCIPAEVQNRPAWLSPPWRSAALGACARFR